MDSGRRKRLIALWDRLAPRYDETVGWAEARYLADCRVWVGARAVGDVLEVAIGTGLNLPHYADGVRVTGVEQSDGMLTCARRRAADLGSQVSFVQADAVALPFAEASFDTVVCTFALCCVEDHRGALAEMHRVLRPGGRLLLADHVASSNPLIRVAQHLIEVVTIPSQGEHWTRRPRNLLDRAGFDLVEAERSVQGMIERVQARKPSEAGSLAGRPGP